MTVLINTAAEVTSQEIVLADKNAVVEFVAKGLTGYEYVQIQVKVNGEWVNLVSAMRPLLRADNNFVTMTGRQTLRLYKPVTTGIVSVTLVAGNTEFSLN